MSVRNVSVGEGEECLRTRVVVVVLVVLAVVVAVLVVVMPNTMQKRSTGP